MSNMMADPSQQKTILLEPSWKNYIAGYVLSILLVPFLGIGFIGLYLVRRRQKRVSYEFSDTQISRQDPEYQRNVDLVNIEQVEVQQNWLQQQTKVGDLILHTSPSSMVLEGIENPENLKDLLVKAIQAALQEKQQKEEPEPKKPDYDPGTMDKMNYLTGLWQQGLVSDEEYKKERKHFE